MVRLSSPVTKHDSSRPPKHASGFLKEVVTSAAAVKAVNPLAEEFDHSASRSYSLESIRKLANSSQCLIIH